MERHICGTVVALALGGATAVAQSQAPKAKPHAAQSTEQPDTGMKDGGGAGAGKGSVIRTLAKSCSR